MRISDWSSDVCSSDLWVEPKAKPIVRPEPRIAGHGSRIDGFRCALPILRTLRACEHRRMTDDRIIAADAPREDKAIQANIRPKSLAAYLGQYPVREHLLIYIEAARRAGDSLSHLLIYGPT